MAQPCIIFIDDDELLLAALRRLFYEYTAKWDMLFFNDPQEALACYRDRMADVIVTDLSMPGMSGLELVRNINSLSHQTQCIVLTGTADLTDATDLINTSNVFRFYTKPTSPEIIAQGIEEALSSSGKARTAANAADKSSPQNDDQVSSILNHLPIGIIATKENGEIIYMNQTASSILAARDGLVVHQGVQIKANFTSDTNDLLAILKEASQYVDEEQIHAVSVERPSHKPPLKLIISGFNYEGNGESQALIFISDPEHDAFPKPEILQKLYGLTPSEARLTSELVRGEPLDDIAKTMEITISSARTYLKRVMSKLNVSRQVELVKLILSLPQVTP